MTIEFSLRRRAQQSRYLAILWLSLAIMILVGTYASLPSVAGRTLSYAHQISAEQPDINDFVSVGKPKPNSHLYATTIAALGLSIIAFACFLLGRTAFIEIELAVRLNGLADALCIGGDSFERFEKSTALLVPQPGYLSIPEYFSSNTRESFLDIVKALRKV